MANQRARDLTHSGRGRVLSENVIDSRCLHNLRPWSKNGFECGSEELRYRISLMRNRRWIQPFEVLGSYTRPGLLRT
jgi:hypothetical protein